MKGPRSRRPPPAPPAQAPARPIPTGTTHRIPARPRVRPEAHILDDVARLEKLVARAEATPLFQGSVEAVLELVADAADLVDRVVAPPRLETLVLLRRAEAFLARGATASALDTGLEAAAEAARAGLAGLEDRAALVQARALVRQGRHEEAIALFHTVIARELPEEGDDPIAPGLAFLAVGEAHLFEGRYEGAYGPLELAVAQLPADAMADRLRYDALVGLGMLDHRVGDFEAAAFRYAAAAALADRHGSPPERTESLLLEACLLRGIGKRALALEKIGRALAISATAEAPERHLSFPTERVRNLVGISDIPTLIDAAVELAGQCGGAGDLMGYVQLCALVATLLDTSGRAPEAVRMLAEVQQSLAAHGQADAAGAIARHALAYSSDDGRG